MRQGVPDTYERSLQLRTAQVLSHFRQDGVTVEKEAFISVPDQALFWRITANRAKVLDFFDPCAERSEIRKPGRGKQASVDRNRALL